MLSDARPLVGLLLPSREIAIWGDDDPAYLIEAARRAEAVGFDSVWIGDSLLARPRPEPLTMLAAVAASTSRVALGSAVLLPLLRHPLLVAHAVSTIDRVARARLILGVGPGADIPGTYEELEAVGADTAKRVSRLVRDVQLYRRIWAGDSEVELRPLPSVPKGPPVWVAAQGPRMLALTGEHFDGWLPYSPSPGQYRQALDAVHESAERHGRQRADITAGVYLTAAVEGNRAEAARALDAFMLAYYGVPAQVMSEVQGCHAGTAESAAEWVAEYAAAGAEHVVLRIACDHRDGYDARVAALFRHVTGLLRSNGTEQRTDKGGPP